MSYALEQGEPKPSSHNFVFQALSAEEGRRAFVDESIEPYFSVLEVLEIAALTRSPAQDIDTEKQLATLRRQTREQLQAQIGSFTADEASLLKQITLRIDELLGTDFPLITAQPWKILKLDSSCCATAHTRSDSIILAQHGIEEMMRLWHESHDIDKVLAGKGSLLLHEQIHVIQRYHPELFAALYQKLWGFTRVATVRGSPWLQKHILHNPDAYDLGYLLAFDPAASDTSPAKNYQLRTLLIPESPVSPRMGVDFKSVAIETEEDATGWHNKLDDSGMPIYVSFEDFKVFHPLEGRAPQLALKRGGDHPHEILAYSFEAILLYHYLAIPIDNSNDREAIKRIKRVARLVLGNPLRENVSISDFPQ